MRFDEFWTDDESQAAGGADAPFPADKRHSATIIGAQVKNLSFKQSDRNPDGRCLVLTVSVAGCRPVEEIIPVNLRGAIEAVLRSARLHATADVAELVDKHVSVETTLRVAQSSGREYCSLKWLPGSDPLPVEIRKAAPRTPARRAAETFKASGTEDDIPF
jgi:hypothetical protein